LKHLLIPESDDRYPLSFKMRCARCIPAFFIGFVVLPAVHFSLTRPSATLSRREREFWGKKLVRDSVRAALDTGARNVADVTEDF